MSTLAVNTLKTLAPSTAPPAVQRGDGVEAGWFARAWVNFNGTGTPAIRAAGNVSSITDNGIGSWTVNFLNALPDANYATQMTGGDNASGVPYCFSLKPFNGAPPISTFIYSTTQVAVVASTNPASGAAWADVSHLCVTIFR